MNHKPYGLYEKIFKRILDFVLSLLAFLVLSPLMIVFIVVGAIVMKGNPFFTQERPGKDEKIFKLIKFRTMTNAKDKDGKLLSDDERTTKYGVFLRNTSIDELPELINILKGDMSIIGPRPLMVRYLPYYTEEEHLRHSVRPGLTGYAQVHGRNSVSWDERFQLDLIYVNKITFLVDIKVLFDTVITVLKREGINLEDLGNLDDNRTLPLNSHVTKR
ncbi:MAG: sugar transferase [Ruminococcus sp.]|nr:sugar transferase [Ruminococcus sp.]